MSSGIELGCSLEKMRSMADASIDSVVTDPPYGLEFMGKEWDAPWKSRGNPAGAGMTAGGFKSGNGYSSRKTPSFGKTWVNMRCTKCNHITSGASPCRCDEPDLVAERGDTSKIMRAFQEWITPFFVESLRVLKPGGHLLSFGGSRTYHRMACAVEDAGFEIRDQIMWIYGTGFPKSKNLDGDWKGWGTALKPAHEPIVVARKPLIGTVAKNVAEFGCGAINVDGCRVELNGDYKCRANGRPSQTGLGDNYDPAKANQSSDVGRWPANVIHDGSEEVVSTFPESGIAARFFYCAKAPKSERGEGNNHPTVKPLTLMQYLCRLVTPPGGLILDPFAGSGTTGVAAKAEGFRFIGFEKDPGYFEIATRRLA
jgi:DNA modification methylase